MSSTKPMGNGPGQYQAPANASVPPGAPPQAPPGFGSTSQYEGQQTLPGYGQPPYAPGAYGQPGPAGFSPGPYGGQSPAGYGAGQPPGMPAPYGQPGYPMPYGGQPPMVYGGQPPGMPPPYGQQRCPMPYGQPPMVYGGQPYGPQGMPGSAYAPSQANAGLWPETLVQKKLLASLAGVTATVVVDCSLGMKDHKDEALIALVEFLRFINFVNAPYGLPPPKVAFISGSKPPEFFDVPPGSESTVAGKIHNIGNFPDSEETFANALAQQINKYKAELSQAEQGLPHRLLHVLTPGDFHRDAVQTIESALGMYARTAHDKRLTPAQHLGVTMIEIHNPKNHLLKRLDKLHALAHSKAAHDMIAVDCHVANHDSPGHVHDMHTRTANVLIKTAEHAGGNHHHRTWLASLESTVEKNIG